MLWAEKSNRQRVKASLFRLALKAGGAGTGDARRFPWLQATDENT